MREQRKSNHIQDLHRQWNDALDEETRELREEQRRENEYLEWLLEAQHEEVYDDESR